MHRDDGRAEVRSKAATQLHALSSAPHGEDERMAQLKALAAQGPIQIARRG